MEPEELNQKLQTLFNSAEAASCEGLTDQAIEHCEAALELLDFNFDAACTYTHSDFLMLAGDACWEDGDVEGSLRYYRHAHETDPGRIDALVALGVALFHLCRFSAARNYLELSSAEDPDAGEPLYYLAILALRDGHQALAATLFERAHEKDPDRWLMPRLLPEEELQKMVEDIYSDFPAEIQQALGNVAIVLEPLPSEDLLQSSEPPLDPLLLGLFEGTPLPDQSGFQAPTGLTQIRLFTHNIALVAPDHDRLVEELEVTLKHEIGHFLGLDEDDLAARGLD